MIAEYTMIRPSFVSKIPSFWKMANNGWEIACAGSIRDAEIINTRIVFILKLYLATIYAHIATKQTVTTTLIPTMIILFRKYFWIGA